MYIFCQSFIRHYLLCICVIVVLISTSISAYADITDSGNSESIHQELRKLKQDMQDGLNSLDIDKKLALITEDAVFTTMNGDRSVGRDAIRQYFDKMLKGPNAAVKKVKVNFEVDELSHLYGDNVAVAFGKSRDEYLLNDGTEFAVEPKWSATMIRQNDKWLIANFHYSTNMFDNPVLTAQRKMFLLGSILIGLISALVGFFIGKKLYKK